MECVPGVGVGREPSEARRALAEDHRDGEQPVGFLVTG